MGNYTKPVTVRVQITPDTQRMMDAINVMRKTIGLNRKNRDQFLIELAEKHLQSEFDSTKRLMMESVDLQSK